MAKKSISWSATANKEWVTLEPTEGFGDSNMKVIVQPAESQDDDLEATITITYGNGKVVNRTVSRCERKPLSNDYSLSFTVSGSYDACFTGQVSITDIKGITVTKLDNGTQTEKTESLSLDDIGVSYIIGGNTLDSMEKNMSTLPRTVKVVGTWNGASYEASITQSAMVVTSSGYSETSVSYSNLYFPSSNPTIAPSCSAGTATFKLMGDKIEKNDTVTAETSCGDIVTLDGSSSEVVTRNVDISSIATFSLCDSAQHNMGEFNGNVLSYESNETDANISLKVCGKVGSSSVSTTYVLPKGSCGKTYYVHIFFDKATVPYKGTQSEMTAKLTYFASLSSDPNDISTAFTDGVELITKSSDRYTIGEPVVDDYVIKRDVTFNTYMGENGVNHTFTAEYEGATASTIIYQASQYENVIPAADYFIFTYSWDGPSSTTDINQSNGGLDLDSLTTISAPIISTVSGKYVGWNTPYKYIGSSSNPYIKWGGDNQQSGNEGAIVNFKAMANDFMIGLEDVIQCDIYANWYKRRDEGNMTINCSAYKGKENGTFSDEIQQVGFAFLPIEGKCEKVWENSFSINVLASGNLNGGVAYVGCVDTTYSLVATLRHNVGTQNTSLIMRQGADNGYNGGFNQTGYGKSVQGAGLSMKTADGTTDFDKYITGTTSSEHKIEWNNITTVFTNQNTNENFGVNMFSNSKDSLRLTLYKRAKANARLTSVTSIAITPNTTYTKADIEGEWIDRLIVSTNADGTFNIYMSVLPNTESSTYSHEFDFGFTKYGAYPPCANKDIHYTIVYYQP